MPHSPPDSPTRQVERIREILVGRQLQQVEQRLARLEGSLRPMPVAGSPALPDPGEAVIALRDEFDAEKLRQMEETRRLAHQIQTIARQRREVAEEARQAVIDELKPGFERWQEGFMSYLEIRENKLRYDVQTAIRELREELPTGRHELDENVRIALANFAGAARQLCETLHPAPGS